MSFRITYEFDTPRYVNDNYNLVPSLACKSVITNLPTRTIAENEIRFLYLFSTAMKSCNEIVITGSMNYKNVLKERNWTHQVPNKTTL